jgi:hypothetical protein
MRRPAEMQLPQVGAVPFKVVECSSGRFGVHVCSPFAPRCAPQTSQMRFIRRCVKRVAIARFAAWADVRENSNNADCVPQFCQAVSG